MIKITMLFCTQLVCVLGFSQIKTEQDSIKALPVQTTQGAPAIAGKVSPGLIIYPNPASNKITMRVTHFDPGMASVKVQDTKGRLVRDDSRLLTNGTEEIVMFLLLKPGIYFIQVSEPGKVARKKLVVL